MAHSISRFLATHPRGLAMLLLGAVLLAALGAQQFRIDASSDSLVVETDPALATWRAMNDRYGSGDCIASSMLPSSSALHSSTRSLALAIRVPFACSSSSSCC